MKRCFSCSQLLVITSTVGNLLLTPAWAQITPDQSLSIESSTVTLDTLINGLPADQVGGGATRGNALFHSFLNFNVLDGERVYFANPVGINQIFSRVTGDQISNVFGTLGVNGDADLYFLNPNGIVFGPDAHIDVRGTFLASTADGFLFPDGLQYSSKLPDTAPLLTVAVSPGLQYGSQAPGSIINGTALAVGQDLILSGGSITSTGALIAPNGQLTVEAVNGDISVQDLAAQSATLSATNNISLAESQLWTTGDLQVLAKDTVIIRDTSKQPAQLVAGGNLIVQGNDAIDIFALNHHESGLFSGENMVLRSPNPVGGDAHYWANGNFRIENLSGELGQLFSPYDPIIRAMGDVEFNTYLGTSLHILAAGSVTANVIVITGPDNITPNDMPGSGVRYVDYLLVEEPGLTLTLPGDPTTGAINGFLQPTLDIRAGMLTSAIGNSPVVGPNNTPISGYNGFLNVPAEALDDFRGVFNNLVFPPSVVTATSADITVSDITITQSNGKILLTNAYQPNLALPGGNIRLGKVPDLPVLLGLGINALGLGGNGSDVLIAARQNIEVDNRSILTSSDVGNAGDIQLLAGGDIEIFGTANPNPIVPDDVWFLAATGNAGSDIELTSYAGDISLAVGSLTTAGESSGSIQLTSELGNIYLNDSTVGIFTSGTGNAGILELKANSIELESAAAIFNATEGLTEGGDIVLQATDKLSITDTGTARTPSVDRLESIINTLNLPPEILPDLPPPELLLAGTGIGTDAVSGPERGGDIVIDAGKLQIQNSSPRGSENRAGISTTSPVNSSVNSGNIRITANEVMITGNDNSSFNPVQDVRDLPKINRIPTGITSSTNGEGQAGTIEIDTNRLLVRDRAGISSGNSLASDSGNGNDIRINARESIDLSGLAVIVSGTTNRGRAGNIFIEMPSGELTVERGAIIAADTFGPGNAGGVDIDAEEINVLSGARIGASTDDSGNAGRLIIRDANRVVVDGVSANGVVPSRLFFSSTGTPNLASDAGNLSVTTQELIVSNGGEIAANTENAGSGGLLFVDADIVQVTGVNSQIAFESQGTGNAQGIEIRSNDLVVENQGIISVSANSTGNAGELTIATQDLNVRNGGQIIGNTENVGDGGGIEIRSNSLTVENRGEISVNGAGDGNSGNINITSNNILLKQQGRITAETRASQGGNINLRVPGSIVMQNDGNPTEATEISARAFGNANGGNITFDVDGFILAVLEENSDVLAAAEAGEGGAIQAFARGIFGFREFQGQVTPESDFTATAALPQGVDGTVDVQTQEPPDPEPLPSDFAGNDIAQGCIASAVQANFSEPQSSLQITGLGGLPRQPFTAQNTAALVIDLVDPVRGSAETTQADLTSQDQQQDDPTHLFISASCISQ